MTIRVIASGDHHWCETLRWDDCVRVHDFMADLVERERPDAFLSGGDVFDRRSTPKEREHVARWLARIADVCPVVVARGNHDESLSLLGDLRAKHPIIIEHRAAVHRIGRLRVAAMAWPARSSLAAMTNGPIEATENAARDALRSVLRGLGQALALDAGPTILLGHFMIDGSVLSAGNPLIGAEMNVGLADLALAGADVTIAAHIHRAQAWEHEGRPILYTGSPFRTAFGEVEEKSVALVTVNAGKVTVERIATPCAPMLLVTALWRPITGSETCDGGFDCVTPNDDVRGAEIRFRYEVRSDLRDAARRGAERFRAQWLAAGAAVVKVEEEVIAETRARAPEIAAARTVEEKLRAMYAHQGVAAERAELLVTRARELEAT